MYPVQHGNFHYKSIVTKSPKIFCDLCFYLKKILEWESLWCAAIRKGKSKLSSFVVFPQEPEKQQVYDIPASPQKAVLGAPAGQPGVSMTRC